MMHGGDHRDWTTAYLAALASPEGAPPFVPQPRAFSAQTVRQAVRLRRGGSSLRLVLSNQFGRAPLVIDQVTLGGGDAGIVVPALHRAPADGRSRLARP